MRSLQQCPERRIHVYFTFRVIVICLFIGYLVSCWDEHLIPGCVLVPKHHWVPKTSSDYFAPHNTEKASVYLGRTTPSIEAFCSKTNEDRLTCI